MAPKYEKEDENLLFIIRGVMDERSIGKWRDAESVYNRLASRNRSADGLKYKFNIMNRPGKRARMRARTRNATWTAKKWEVMNLLLQGSIHGGEPSVQPTSLSPATAPSSISNPTSIPQESSLLVPWNVTAQHSQAAGHAPAPDQEPCMYAGSATTLNPFANDTMLSALAQVAGSLADVELSSSTPSHEPSSPSSGRFGDADNGALGNAVLGGLNGTVTTPISGTEAYAFQVSNSNTGIDMNMAAFGNQVPGTNHIMGMDPATENATETCYENERQWSSDMSSMDSESIAIMNALAWDNAQAWISPDDLYFLSPESEATFEAI